MRHLFRYCLIRKIRKICFFHMILLISRRIAVCHLFNNHLIDQRGPARRMGTTHGRGASRTPRSAPSVSREEEAASVVAAARARSASVPLCPSTPPPASLPQDATRASRLLRVCECHHPSPSQQGVWVRSIVLVSRAGSFLLSSWLFFAAVLHNTGKRTCSITYCCRRR